MNNLKLLDNFNQELQLLENSIKKLSDSDKELTILEAGCGRNWPLNLGDINYKLLGVDLDADALDFRVNVQKDLDESFVADLQNFDIGDRQVDVIYNSFVLEHVQDAEQMLDNFYNILKPGGLLILRFPDRNTVFGFLTRFSPFWVHVMYKKYIEGIKEAGKPGFAPYPTHYHKVVSRDGIREYCKTKAMVINEEYGFCAYLVNNNLRTKMIRLIAITVHLLSLGKLPWKYNNLTYVLTKT